MHVTALELTDFRNYRSATITLTPGTNLFLGPNGHGKTNLAEAICYLATLSSHRTGSDTALVRAGAGRAVIRARAVRRDRELSVELELNPGRANRAQLNGSSRRRTRDVLGAVRAVLFAPEDLALVNGDPSERRRFLDNLLVSRTPRLAGVRADYDRVVKQRTALLKSIAGSARRQRGSNQPDARSLDAWDAALATTGAPLLEARLALVDELRPLIEKNYAAVATAEKSATIDYRTSCALPAAGRCSRDQLTAALAAAIADARPQEMDRGLCLVGPHRDELELGIGALPARGYASHGEAWSLALAMRLASYDLLRSDDPGGEPLLVLDDVFAELDATRRTRLAELVTPAEQLLVTAAVADDVPMAVDGLRYDVYGGVVTRAA